MHALGRLEHGLRRLLEGRLSRWLGARTQPVDLAKRMADHMDDHRVIGAGRVYVPNNYRAYLAPRTLADFAGTQSVLQEDLAAFLDAHARDRGYELVGRVRVSLLADPAVRGEDFRVEADLVDRAGGQPGPGQGTQAIPVPSPAPGAGSRGLVVLAGSRRFAVPASGVSHVGRSLDNDVILDHPSVSRKHARLTPRAGSWLLEDLDSTHGTYVNGRRVSASLVRPGDQLRLGAVLLHLEPDTEGRS